MHAQWRDSELANWGNCRYKISPNGRLIASIGGRIPVLKVFAKDSNELIFEDDVFYEAMGDWSPNSSELIMGLDRDHLRKWTVPV